MPRFQNDYEAAKAQGLLWTPMHERSNARLIAWYTMNDAAFLAASGTGVDTLRDKSGFGRAMTTPGGTQPTFTRHSVWKPRPSATFASASGQYLRGFSVNGGTQSSMMWFAACTMSNSAHANARLLSLNPSGEVDYISGFIPFYRPNFNTDIGSYFQNSVAPAIGVPFDTPLNLATVHDGTTATLYLDGTAGTGGATATTTAPSFALGEIWVGRGGYNTTNTENWSGEVGEVIGYSGYNRQTALRTMAYLAWEWGTVARLNASNPYKRRPPLIGS